MAIFDALYEFSDAQSIAADAQSTNVLDWGSGMEDLEMGAGNPLWLNIQIETAPTAGTNLIVTLYRHTAATSINSGTAIWTSPTILRATLTAGYWIYRMPLPVNCDEDRYIGLFYNQTGTLTAGTVNAWIDHGPQSSYDTQVSPSNI